jgi:pilus assembly protein CpaB
MKQRLILILSVLIGVLAFVLTGRYLQAERERLFRDARKIEVIVASRNLPGGSTLRREDLAIKQVYESAVGENVFRPEDHRKILDKRLQYGLRRGEPVWWSYVDLPESARGGLAPMIREGLRAVALPISGAAGVSGHVRPNDRVDLLGTFTFPSADVPGEMESVTLTVLQDVTVLATGQRLARDDGMAGPSGGYSTMTFEVTPREAELLVFAEQARGQLYVALRNPGDVSFEDALPSVNFDHLQTRLPELNRYRQQSIRHKKEF